MPRSSEERAAVEALHAAIVRMCEVKGFAHNTRDGSPMLLTDWIVIGTQRGYDESGDGVTGVLRLEGPGEDTSWITILGLMEAGRLSAIEQYTG